MPGVGKHSKTRDIGNRPANGDCDSNTEKGERGRRDGRGERRVSTLPKKWKGEVYQLISEREECEGVTNMEQRATGLVVVKHGRTGDTEINRAGSRHL